MSNNNTRLLSAVVADLEDAEAAQAPAYTDQPLGRSDTVLVPHYEPLCAGWADIEIVGLAQREYDSGRVCLVAEFVLAADETKTPHRTALWPPQLSQLREAKALPRECSVQDLLGPIQACFAENFAKGKMFYNIVNFAKFVI